MPKLPSFIFMDTANAEIQCVPFNLITLNISVRSLVYVASVDSFDRNPDIPLTEYFAI